MLRFSYARTGKALHSYLNSLLLMLVGDVVFLFVVALLLHGLWRLTVWLGGAALTGVAIWILRRPLRTYHSLDSVALTLQFGRFHLVIPRAAIRSAVRYEERPPRTVPNPTMPPYFQADQDTLHILADRAGTVLIELAQPLSTITKRQGRFTFGRVLLSVDDPAALVAALNDEARPDSKVVQVAEAAGLGPVAPTGVVRTGGTSAIRLDGLVKRFGDFTAVRQVELGVAPGEIMAFLGSNGAGKTTTVKMMVGLLRPTAGRVWIQGHDLWQEGPGVRRRIGYVPDVPLLYEGLTAREFLWLMAGLYEMPPAEGRRRADELLALLKLTEHADHLIRSFSLGMKRKMAIGAALMHRPQVLVLDEVTNGLDPRAAREVKDLILAAAGEGIAVFLTTHLLDMAQELAQRIAIIHRGEVRAQGSLDELRSLMGRADAGLEELFLHLTADGPVHRAEVGA
ncbi:MAG: ABC transporter ATP-binding protein [Mycobacterium leprae]